MSEETHTNTTLWNWNKARREGVLPEEWLNLCAADLREADLREADLCAADLRAADLCAADLCEADLRAADLREAKLYAADLYAADLRAADLCAADLCEADLRAADLREANLRAADIIVIKNELWDVFIQGDSIRIGCQFHTAAEWDAFDDDAIRKMSSSALDWWRVYKPLVMAAAKITMKESNKEAL